MTKSADGGKTYLRSLLGSVFECLLRTIYTTCTRAMMVTGTMTTTTTAMTLSAMMIAVIGICGSVERVGGIRIVVTPLVPLIGDTVINTVASVSAVDVSVSVSVVVFDSAVAVVSVSVALHCNTFGTSGQQSCSIRQLLSQ